MNRQPFKFKVGDKVDFHTIVGGRITSTDHIVAYVDKLCGMNVYWITGYVACVDEDNLTSVPQGTLL